MDTNKKRKIVAVGSKGPLVFDDLNKLERLKLFEKGINIYVQANDFGEYQLIYATVTLFPPILR